MICLKQGTAGWILTEFDNFLINKWRLCTALYECKLSQRLALRYQVRHSQDCRLTGCGLIVRQVEVNAQVPTLMSAKSYPGEESAREDKPLPSERQSECRVAPAPPGQRGSRSQGKRVFISYTYLYIYIYIERERDV